MSNMTKCPTLRLRWHLLLSNSHAAWLIYVAAKALSYDIWKIKAVSHFYTAYYYCAFCAIHQHHEYAPDVCKKQIHFFVGKIGHTHVNKIVTWKASVQPTKKIQKMHAAPGLHCGINKEKLRCLETIRRSPVFASWLVLISYDSTTSGECKML